MGFNDCLFHYLFEQVTLNLHCRKDQNNPKIFKQNSLWKFDENRNKNKEDVKLYKVSQFFTTHFLHSQYEYANE